MFDYLIARCRASSGLYRSREPILGGSPFGWITTKAAPWLKDLNVVMLRFIESGFYAHYIEQTKASHFTWEDCYQPPNRLKPLTVNHVNAAFYILAFGFGAATVLFLVELIWCRRKFIATFLNRNLD